MRAAHHVFAVRKSKWRLKWARTAHWPAKEPVVMSNKGHDKKADLHPGVITPSAQRADNRFEADSPAAGHTGADVERPDVMACDQQMGITPIFGELECSCESRDRRIVGHGAGSVVRLAHGNLKEGKTLLKG
uniref:Transposase n=1 Tax=Steinernema glaseri TaxID=37863 RepID=A0A1I7ZKU2_9BILA